jgi:hypothetical protein
MPLVFNDPLHRARRAEEARALAAKMTDIDGRLQMLVVAEQYKKLAERATERLKHGAIIRSRRPNT